MLIDPFRPGIMEKLGLGPDQVLAINPKIIYARMTGWGQTGDFSAMAGHDINYIGLSGALSVNKTYAGCGVVYVIWHNFMFSRSGDRKGGRESYISRKYTR